MSKLVYSMVSDIIGWIGTLSQISQNPLQYIKAKDFEFDFDKITFNFDLFYLTTMVKKLTNNVYKFRRFDLITFCSFKQLT